MSEMRPRVHDHVKETPCRPPCPSAESSAASVGSVPGDGGEAAKDGQFLIGWRPVTRQDYLAFTSALGFGDDVSEPAATPAQLLDPIQEAFHFAREHVECPEWCDDCDQWERPRSCEPCNGSGCSPLTALGAYDPCAHCAGDGRTHEPYTLTGTWRGEPAAAPVEAAEGPLRRILALCDLADAAIEDTGLLHTRQIRAALAGTERTP